MTASSPQFLYMILVLPSLFGMALVGEGVNKMFHEEWIGVISLIFGFMFIGAVIFIYLFFSSYLAIHKVG